MIHAHRIFSTLHHAVAVRLTRDQPRGFSRWDAADQWKWDPAVPILYVGVPLMLAVWTTGLWLLLRRRRAAVEHSVPVG